MNRLLPHPAAPRAVIIDGDGGDREAAIAACRELGIAVDGWAACGAAGLELIESLPAPPDLVILDPHLPDMDGADLLLALSMLTREPGIVICGGACPRLRDAALSLAAALGLAALGALPKPARAPALRAAVQAWAPAASRARAANDERAAHGPDGAPGPSAERIMEGLRRRQFELHYQPKIALADGGLRGAEALLRWRLPGQGLLAPGRFLPRAEAAGLVDMLTMEVLRLALADWRAWNAAGLALPLSVNLSPLSLADPHLAAQLIAAVTAARVPPFLITFEIVEHAEIADLATALRILIKLRLHGFGLSLDDFGAGHASLLRLSRFPFTELKLDRRLVHHAARRPHVRPLLRHAIGTARELGVVAVAEGIETEEDRALLRELGCDLAQGYLIAHPMPAAELPRWHASRRPRAAPPCGGVERDQWRL